MLFIFQSTSVEAKATLYGFSVEADAKYATSRESTYSSTVNVLKSGKGEVMLGKATCITNNVVLAPYSRQKFAPSFIQGLKVRMTKKA